MKAGGPVHLRVGDVIVCGVAHLDAVDSLRRTCCRLDPRRVTCPECKTISDDPEAGR